MTYEIGEMEFVRTKFTALDGKTMVVFQENNSDFQIRASSQGIQFKGTMAGFISSNLEVQDFARMFSDVVEQHHKLKPKLATGFNDKEF